MSDSAFATIVGANLGSQLMEIMLCDGIEPGSSPSYETCKLIYLYHPMGAKLAEEPCRLAMSQQREISIPNSPETLIKEAFEKEWRTLRCNQIILQVMTLSSVYGASALIYGSEDFPLNEPIDPKELAKLDIYFNVFDPLNVAGSLITNQAPNSPDFQKHGDIVSNGKSYHRSRACVVYNEQPIYIAYSQSAFGYVGRSVYQRALYQLKGFINSMITDNHVQEKAGLLIIKSKKPGSIIDNIMTSVAAVKRSMLKGAKTGNVLEVGADDAVETLNMQNVDVAMTTSRTNIINNIALAAGRPAILLTEEAYTQGFGEGTEDAKKVARFIDGYREEMQPLYEFLDPIIQYRAWSESFYETIQAQFSEYQAIPYETAIMQWKNSFVASWPNLLKEPDSEAIKVEETKFKAVNEAVLALKDDLDPDNKARLFEWMADCFNEQKLLFQNPLDLDFDAMVQYQEQQKAEQKEAEAQQMQQLQQGKQEGSFADSAPIPAGASWITLESGQHVLIGKDGKVIGGAGGALDGKYYGSHGENSPNKTITKNYNEEIADKENKPQDNVAKSAEKSSKIDSRSNEAGKPGDTTMNATPQVLTSTYEGKGSEKQVIYASAIFNKELEHIKSDYEDVVRRVNEGTLDKKYLETYTNVLNNPRMMGVMRQYANQSAADTIDYKGLKTPRGSASVAEMVKTAVAMESIKDTESVKYIKDALNKHGNEKVFNALKEEFGTNSSLYMDYYNSKLEMSNADLEKIKKRLG